MSGEDIQIQKLGSETFGDQPRATEPGLESGSRVFIFGTLGATASCSLDFFWSAQRESCTRADMSTSHSSSCGGSPFQARCCCPPATPLLPTATSKPKALVEKPGGWNQSWRSENNDWGQASTRGDERPPPSVKTHENAHSTGQAERLMLSVTQHRPQGRTCDLPQVWSSLGPSPVSKDLQ